MVLLLGGLRCGRLGGDHRATLVPRWAVGAVAGEDVSPAGPKTPKPLKYGKLELKKGKF